jgi:hypothetical protein
MARGAIVAHVVNRTGLDRSTITETTGVPADGHYVTNDTGMWIEVRNSNAVATARTVSFNLSGGADGQSIVPKTKSIAAGKTFVMGPWPSNMYGGQLLIDVDHAELMIAAFKLG